MTDTPTIPIQADIPRETRLRVKAYNQAKSGSWDNTVAELLEAGIRARLAVSPKVFEDCFHEHLAAMKMTGEP